MLCIRSIHTGAENQIQLLRSPSAHANIPITQQGKHSESSYGHSTAAELPDIRTVIEDVMALPIFVRFEGLSAALSLTVA